MVVDRHLSDAELGELLQGTPNSELREHAEGCAPCREDVRRLAAATRGLKQELGWVEAQPEYFWTRQRAQIAARLAEPAGSLRWAFAGGLALLALATVLLMNPPSASLPPAPAAAQNQAVDPDEQLLREIEHSLSHQVPGPLMPATLLVQEIDANHANPDQMKEN